MVLDTSSVGASHRDWMELALEEADRAAESGEVPVGAVIVLESELLATGHNRTIAEHDPTAHAEIVVIRKAGTLLSNYRLTGATLYVTLEPCLMCAGAILNARIEHVVYGARDPKAGAAGSLLDALQNPMMCRRAKVTGGVEAHRCAALLDQFFRQRRL